MLGAARRALPVMLGRACAHQPPAAQPAPPSGRSHGRGPGLHAEKHAEGTGAARTALGQRAQRLHDEGHQAFARAHGRLALAAAAGRHEPAADALRGRTGR